MKAVTEELVWINGKIMPLAQARIGLEDRGFNFADGVYEVVRFYRGRTFTLDEHLNRLVNSADAIRIPLSIPQEQLAVEIRRLVDQSQLDEGMIYLQLTRGEAPRSHPFPPSIRPTLFFYARTITPAWKPGEGAGYRLLTVEDERWHKCWIKSLALLPNILAKNTAIEAGCDEAAFCHDGRVNECSASNLFCVKDGTLYTCPVGRKVLPGITRTLVIRLAGQLGLPVQEASLPLEVAKQADEVFITSTTREVNWVRQWDDQTIGTGRCGEITRRLHEAYVEAVEAEISQREAQVA